ncbi:hypothetical protein J3E73DRAFT_385866 [Bipolaris maydis]|nr:hypothetical protein J3E73DRAFT_386413 [Bipolaris maydis]KAJ5021112.1 hypothetical protein J3E73DRAFT_386106 [Bipolaris maydis]KAJ5021741.1 hypothetical protein J3E73DRAFT_385866 [Bipolaris maydis]
MAASLGVQTDYTTDRLAATANYSRPWAATNDFSAAIGQGRDQMTERILASAPAPSRGPWQMYLNHDLDIVIRDVKNAMELPRLCFAADQVGSRAMMCSY